MPRSRNEDRPQKVTISVPETVITRVNLLLIDPMTLKPAYGALSMLMTSLLKQWLSEQGSKEVVENTVTTTTETKEPVND